MSMRVRLMLAVGVAMVMVACGSVGDAPTTTGAGGPSSTDSASGSAPTTRPNGQGSGGMEVSGEGTARATVGDRTYEFVLMRSTGTDSGCALLDLELRGFGYQPGHRYPTEPLDVPDAGATLDLTFQRPLGNSSRSLIVTFWISDYSNGEVWTGLTTEVDDATEESASGAMEFTRETPNWLAASGHTIPSGLAPIEGAFEFDCAGDIHDLTNG